MPGFRIRRNDLASVGRTDDTFIADLAVGSGWANQVRCTGAGNASRNTTDFSKSRPRPRSTRSAWRADDNEDRRQRPHWTRRPTPTSGQCASRRLSPSTGPNAPMEKFSRGARQELCSRVWNVNTCARVRRFWSVIVNDVLIASQDGQSAADELQICRFHETQRVSCTEATRWRPMLRSRESRRTKLQL